MKRKIMIVVMAMVVMIASTCGCYASGKYDGMSWKISKTKGGYITKFYDNGKYNCKVFTKKKLKVKVIKEENVNYNLLVSRENNFILVEKIKGKCINKKGDGRDSLGYYISYKGVKGHKKGGKYTTYCVYDNNQYEDDIIGRMDYKRK